MIGPLARRIASRMAHVVRSQRNRPLWGRRREEPDQGGTPQLDLPHAEPSPLHGAISAGCAMTAIKALLLTDVVDSTRLSEMLGDSAMADVWAAHDRVSRALLGPWRGR